MLTQSFPSLRPKPAPVVYQQRHHQPYFPTQTGRVPTSWDITCAEKFKISPAEFVRRDDIVRKQWRECKFIVGDVLMPVSEAAREKYGTNVKVEGIYRGYNEFHPNEEWPKDDQPFILTVRPEKGLNGGRLFCTPDFLMRVPNASSC